MMTVDEAFKEGMRLVREVMNLPPEKAIRGSDIACLAAYNVFVRRCRGKESDERFEADAPLYAKRIILEAYSKG